MIKTLVLSKIEHDCYFFKSISICMANMAVGKKIIFFGQKNMLTFTMIDDSVRKSQIEI